jgi:antitoxin (DNA-binding transcriptional repressor) of toxin-antitoxin stability system
MGHLYTARGSSAASTGSARTGEALFGDARDEEGRGQVGVDEVATWRYDVATMATVSVRELKNRLSEHLRRLEDGETITVTRRGKPVAVMTAPPGGEGRDEALQRKLLELQAKGILAQVGRVGTKPKGLSPGIKLKGKGPSMSEMVLEDRGEPIP